MKGLLIGLSLLLLGIISAIILVVVFRELILDYRKRKWLQKKQECLNWIGKLEAVEPDEVYPLILQLQNTYSPSLVEAALDDFSHQADNQLKIADIYDRLGLLDKYLLDLKQGSSWSKRANAAERLGNIGHSKAILPLVQLIQNQDEDWGVKNIAIKALGKIKDDQAIPHLIKGLGLPDQSTSPLLSDILVSFGKQALKPIIMTLSTSKLESQRFWCAYILKQMKDSEAIPALLSALTDPVAKVRAQAARALGALNANEAILALNRALLEDPDPLVRNATAEALGALADDKSLVTLMAGLADADRETQWRLIDSIEKMGAKSLPFLLNSLKNGPQETKLLSALALERLGIVSNEIENLSTSEQALAYEILCQIAEQGVIETLCRSLNHPNLQVRIYLCRILEKYPHHRAFEALNDLAQKDTEWAGRLAAMLALIKLSNIQSAPLIQQALLEEEETLREHLLISLKQISINFVKELWQPIVQLFQDQNIKIRILAVEVLSRLHETFLAPYFLQALSDSHWKVRQKAAESLARFHTNEVLKALIDALKDPSMEVRVAAVRSLGALEDPRAIEPLAFSFEWSDDHSRNEIAMALAAISEEFHPLADLLMGLPNPKSRGGVVLTLGLIGDQNAVPLVTHFLKDSDSMVRAIAAMVLGKMGAFTEDIKASLLAGLEDPNEWVRASIANVLGKCPDLAIIPQLVSRLSTDPSQEVCQNLVLAIGSLSFLMIKPPEVLSSEQVMSQITFGSKQEKKPSLGAEAAEVSRSESILAIQSWLKVQERDEKSLAAGLIALGLLRDSSNFNRIFAAIQKPSFYKWFNHFLLELSQYAREGFLSFLGFHQNVIWPEESLKSWEHYKDILQSGRDPQIRIRAIQALSLLKEKSSQSLIELSFANDPSPQVRAAALVALNNFLDSHMMVNKILEAALDPSLEVRNSLIEILKEIDSQSLRGIREKLIPLLNINDSNIRNSVAKILALLYGDEWPLLIDLLLGTNEKFLIIGLIEILREVGDPKTKDLLKDLTRHSDPEVRSASAEAAAKLGLFTKSDWADCLRDPQEAVRLNAVYALGKLLDGDALRLLSLHLEDPSWQIRWEIAMQLGLMEKQTEVSLEMLKSLSKDMNAFVAIRSLLSLFQVSEEKDVSELVSKISSLDEKDREVLLTNLDKEKLTDKLILGLENGYLASERKAAIQILSAFNLPLYANEILIGLQDPSSDVRVAAIEALKRSAMPMIQQKIEALLNDPSEKVREAARRTGK